MNQAEDLLRREKNLEEAKKVVIKNDPSLPEPKCVSRVRSSVLDTWPVLQCLVCTKIESVSALWLWQLLKATVLLLSINVTSFL